MANRALGGVYLATNSFHMGTNMEGRGGLEIRGRTGRLRRRWCGPTGAREASRHGQRQAEMRVGSGRRHGVIIL